MISKKKKNIIFLKYFILFFLISFFVANWASLSWLFNYKALPQMVSQLFEKETLPKNSEVVIKKDIKIKQGSSQLVKKKEVVYSKKENWLEIPKINISIPLIFPDKKDPNFKKLLDRGAVFFPNSSLPGQLGQTIILGHSAPPHWPKIKHDWIFTKISTLRKGDKIFVYHGFKKYEFTVIGQTVIQRGENVPRESKSAENELELVSCWPPGKDIERMAVSAILDNF